MNKDLNREKEKMSVTTIKKLEKMSKHTNIFLYSYWAIVTIFTFTLITTILTLIPSILSDGEVAWGITAGLTMIAFVSSILGLMGDVLLHRNKKSCFYFYFGFILIYIINVAYNNLWYETATQILMLIIVFTAFMNWGRPGSDKKINVLANKSFAVVWLHIIEFTLLLGLIMWMANEYLIDDISKKDPFPFLDAFISVTFITGWLLMTQKSIQAYIVYVACTIATLILCVIMITQGQWYYLIYASTNIFYLFFYFIGSSNWISIIEKEKVIK